MKTAFLGPVDITRRLPHRFPFLMIDRVVKWGGDEVVAIKNVTVNEPFFPGHFPSEPIMPGVLIGEAMAQASAFLGEASAGSKAFLVNINLGIKKPVVPGDQLVITSRLVKRFGKLMKISARCEVEGEIVAEAELTVASP
jgi:3-hydroxyacyl-[acyl-carrier-protein] dehydratase